MDTDDLKISPTCQIPILQHFYHLYLPNKGTFVEVGAFDGDSYSNTSCLADIGWTGFYIEPVPKFAGMCLERHRQNDVKVFPIAIDDEIGQISLSLGGALSTASQRTSQAYSQIPWAQSVEFHDRINVEAVTLNEFLAFNKIQRKFELLVVDVEGLEERVFRSFHLDHWNPKMIIVELCDYHKSFEITPDLQSSARKVRDKILAADYMQVYGDYINSIFVSKC